MARWLKVSTSVDVPIGPFLATSDGFTASTALTLTQPDIRLKKNGGAWAQKAAAQTLSHEENGYYEVTLDATDTNTLGLLRLAVNETGALPVWEDFLVVTANVYDSLFSTDVLDVSVTQWLGTAAATPTTAGVPEVDVTHWIGTAAATPTTAGVPEVDVTHWIGTAAATPTVPGVPEVDLTHVAGVTTSVSTLASSVATILAAVGALADAAADGDPTASDTAMAYLKQIVNTLVGTAGIVTFPTSAVPANAISLAEVIRQIYDEVAGLNGGTPLDAAGIRTAVGLASANLDTQIGDLPTNAELTTALAALGALTDAAADGDPTSTDTLVQYVKQIVNVLVGAAGVVTFPAAAAPANAISLAEVIRQIYDEVAGVNGITPLDAVATRAAVGLASANLDTQIAAVQADTDNIQTRLPAALTGAGNMKSDALAINGSTTAAANLALAPLTYVTGTVNDASAAAGEFNGDNALSATDNFYQYGVLVFVSGTTLHPQARQISAYVGATRTFQFTGTGENADAPFSAAPTNGDAFMILGRIGT